MKNWWIYLVYLIFKLQQFQLMYYISQFIIIMIIINVILIHKYQRLHAA